jgi:pilus assembly protein CpaE
MRPSLTIQDLIEAGSRVDGDMLRAATATHASGLRVLAAPSELLPLDAFTNDAVISLIALAQKEFGTVFIDLPSNWTNWSLSLVARADIVLLVTEMSVSCLHRARRQLDLLRSQDMAGLDVRIVVNRVEKGLLRSVKLNDVEKSLGREVGFTIANDHPLMRSAIDRGVPLWEVKPKSALGKDIEALSANLASLLGSGA